LPAGAAIWGFQLVDGLASGAPDRLVVIANGAISSREILGSDDGLSWRLLGTGPGWVFAMDGGFVAIREGFAPKDRSIQVSRDGTNWVRPDAGDADSLRFSRGYWSAYRAGTDWIAVPDDVNDDRPFTWLLWFDADP
jgi:hypothetical protein